MSCRPRRPTATLAEKFVDVRHEPRDPGRGHRQALQLVSRYFTHQPSHFVRLGFSIVPHVWVPEKIAHDCVGCSQFRHCGQYAVSLQLRAGAGLRLDLLRAAAAVGRATPHERRAPAAPPRLGMTGPAVTDRHPRRGHRRQRVRAGGLPRGRRGLRHQEVERAGPRADRQRHAGVERGRLHDEQGGRGAGARLQGAAPGVGRALARRRDQQRLRERLHGPRRLSRPRRPWRTPRRGAAGVDPSQVLVASTGVIGVSLDRQRVTDGIAAAAKALARDGGPAAARAIMTTDPFPKEAAVEVTTPSGTFRVGGIAKGSGMIEPLMATMLGVVTTDATDRAGAPAARADGGDGRHVQRDHGGRRVLDQRLRLRARERRERRDDRARRTSICSSRRCAGSASRWRSGSSAAAKARPS